MPTNLPLGDGPDPAERQVDGNSHHADDPEHARVILAVVAENDGEDDAAQVASSARAAGDDACKCFSSALRPPSRHETTRG